MKRPTGGGRAIIHADERTDPKDFIPAHIPTYDRFETARNQNTAQKR
jgi:hypothetical protein